MLTVVISRRWDHDHFILCAFSRFPNFLNDNTFVRSWEEGVLETSQLENKEEPA